MKIDICCVGKVKESYFRDAIKEYAKRLSRYTSLQVLEVADEKTPDGASEAMEIQIKEKEGARILAKLKEDAYVIALAIDGKKKTSEKLAGDLERLTVQGHSHIQFVIGGSLVDLITAFMDFATFIVIIRYLLLVECTFINFSNPISSR